LDEHVDPALVGDDSRDRSLDGRLFLDVELNRAQVDAMANRVIPRLRSLCGVAGGRSAH